MGHIETITSMSIFLSSLTMLWGSDQYFSSNIQVPWLGQWKKSITITEMGSFLRLYSRATSSNSSCVLYRNLHCQNLLIRLTQQYTRYSGPDFGLNLHHPGCRFRPNSSALYNCRYVGAAADIPIDKMR